MKASLDGGSTDETAGWNAVVHVIDGVVVGSEMGDEVGDEGCTPPETLQPSSSSCNFLQRESTSRRRSSSSKSDRLSALECKFERERRRRVPLPAEMIFS